VAERGNNVSWSVKSDLDRIGGKDGIKDPRFVIEHSS
jgi:hypothetical protein